MINNTNEVREFLLKNPIPIIVTVQHMKQGFVTCISPIKTICGAELRCHPSTRQCLVKFIRAVRSVNDK